MKIVLTLAIIIFVFACSPSKVEETAMQYEKSIEQGQLFEQLKLIDKLYQLSPSTYGTLNKKKNALKVFIEQLHQPLSDPDDLSITQIEALLALSPNYPLFINLQKLYVQEQKRKQKISNLLNKISIIYQETEEKIIRFPKHIKQTKTEIIIKNTFYSNLEINNELRSLFEHLQNNKLTTYQLESLLVGLSHIAIKNGMLITHKPSDDKNLGEFHQIIKAAKKTNQIIYRLMNHIYSQQLALCIQWIEQQNIQLQRLVRTALGIRDMNSFWEKEYTPTATKMQKLAEKNHIESLLKINTYRLSIPLIDEANKITITKPKVVKKIIISLLWPQEGIYEFYDQSEIQLQILKKLNI